MVDMCLLYSCCSFSEICRYFFRQLITFYQSVLVFTHSIFVLILRRVWARDEFKSEIFKPNSQKDQELSNTDLWKFQDAPPLKTSAGLRVKKVGRDLLIKISHFHITRSHHVTV